MKINKIYISAFGGLKDFTLDLSDGLNVIYGNNEDGKSTVLAFIKAMFYGTGRNTKSLAESVRQKYTPWDNSQMAGRIFFEHNNKRYCLEREFRKSDSTDRISLTDLDSGKALDTGDNIGQQFFGLSAAAFERSLFIGNGNFIKDDTAAGEINGKLSNIALSGSEDVSLKKIEKNIFDTRAKLISKNGKSGSYNEDLQQLNLLNERLKKAHQDAKSKALLNEKASQMRSEYETLYKKYTELKSIVDREQDIKNREKLTEFLETKRKLDELNSTLTLSDGTIINEAFAQKIDFGINKYEASFERCEQINQDIENLKAALALQSEISPEDAKEQITILTNDINQQSDKKSLCESDAETFSIKVSELERKFEEIKNKKAVFNPLFLCLSIVLAASGGATAFFVSTVVAAVLCGVAAVLLALTFIVKPKNSSAIAAAQNELANANTALAELKAEKNNIDEKINNINARINTLKSVVNADDAVKGQLNQKTEVLTAEQLKTQTAKAELFALLSGFGNIDSVENAKELLQQLKLKTEQQKEIKLQLKTASQFLGNIDYDKAKEKLDAIKDGAALENIDFDAVKTEYNSITDRLSALKEDLTIIATELKASFKNSENPEDLKREINTLQERLDSKKAFCDAADIAISVLQESFYELRRGYGSELEQATHSIFAKLTDSKYKSVSVTDTLDLSVEKADVFGTREIGFLSLGATHQAYLSLRLAITKLISDNNNMPIFLDDALSQYDDTRTEKAITFLKEFCQGGQGILFTCHNSICEIAQKQDIKIQKPYN